MDYDYDAEIYIINFCQNILDYTSHKLYKSNIFE